MARKQTRIEKLRKQFEKLEALHAKEEDIMESIDELLEEEEEEEE